MMRAAILVLGLALAGCVAKADIEQAKTAVKGEVPVIRGSLEGGPWVAEDINGGGVMDNARVDISFDPGDAGTSAVYGRSGCNRFKGSWKQDGSTIRLGPLASTMMACPPALMDLERKFLGALEAATTVEFDATGAAYLKAPDGRVVKLRREAK